MRVDSMFFEFLGVFGGEWDYEVPPNSVFRFDYLQCYAFAGGDGNRFAVHNPLFPATRSVGGNG